MAITTVSLSKSKHYFSARLSALTCSLDNLELGPRAAEHGATPPLPSAGLWRGLHGPQRACVRAHLCVCVPVWAHARPCAHVPVPGKGLEDDLKCAFYQPSKLRQPKDGRAGTHGGQTVVDPEYEFSSFHSEPEMGGATGQPALAFPLVSSI